MNKISFFLRTAKYKPNIRLISTLNTQCDKHDLPQNSSLKIFTPVYKFPYIRALSIINRLKLYQTTFTAIAIPGSLILCELDIVHPDGVMATAVLGLTGCVSLYTLGIFANKFIGFVYLNKEENSVKVAYLDFWGRRRDEEVPLKDIVPFSEIPVSLTDGLYLKFSRFSAEETLKINLKYGQVLDKEKFNKVFAKYH